MQTFLMYKSSKENPNYAEIVKTLNKTIVRLDYKRLGKQRVEAMQIIDIHEGRSSSSAWVNHPAVKMWKDNIECLKLYHNLCINEWMNRGYKNTMIKYDIDENKVSLPDWLTKEFIDSHRSNLLRKYFSYYKQFNWNVPDNLPYVWPK